MANKKFKFLEHTADVKFQSFGKTLSEAFENAALAMFNVMYSGKVKEKIKKKIKVKGKDLESLLYNFLEEILFLLDAENFLLAKIKNLKIEGGKLWAELVGDKASNYKFTNEVKAVTYNEMFVKKVEEKGKEKFICQVVLDV